MTTKHLSIATLAVLAAAALPTAAESAVEGEAQDRDATR